MIREFVTFIMEKPDFMVAGCIFILILHSWIRFFIVKEYNFIAPYGCKCKGFQYQALEEMKNKIYNMENREFEYFCEWLLNQTGKYKRITLTPSISDESKNLILITHEDEKVFVEHKRCIDAASKTDRFVVEKEMCQKLAGAILSEDIQHGMIITTGNVHQDAWDYVWNLEKKADIRIEIIGMKQILDMLQELDCEEDLEIIKGDA